MLWLEARLGILRTTETRLERLSRLGWLGRATGIRIEKSRLDAGRRARVDIIGLIVSRGVGGVATGDHLRNLSMNSQAFEDALLGFGLQSVFTMRKLIGVNCSALEVQDTRLYTQLGVANYEVLRASNHSK